MRKRYRYITCGIVNPTDPINEFRLIGGNQLAHDGERRSHVIRVEISDDIKLEKLSCDNYSTTESDRTIEEIGYDVMVCINGKWRIRNDLKKYHPCDISDVLRDKENLYVTKIGYLDKERFKEYLSELDREREETEKTAKQLKSDLDNRKIGASDLEFASKKTLIKLLSLYVTEKGGIR